VAISRLQEPGYASAEWGLSAAETYIRLHLLFFLTNLLGLNPGLAGLLISLGVLWDGVTDPLVGWLSDRTRSRWGRRFPFLLLGLFAFPTLLFVLFWSGWQELSVHARVWGFALAYLAFNTATTCLAVPHAALAGDLSQDDPTRTRLFAWRYFFTTMGLLSGIAVPGYLLSSQGNVLSTYETSGLLLAGIGVISAGLTILSSYREDWQNTRLQKVEQAALGSFLKTMLRNRPFLILITAFVFATVGQAINSSLALYYYRLYLKLPEADIQKILGVFTVVIVGSILGWNLLSRRYSKTLLLALGVGALGIAGSLSYPFFAPGDLRGPYVMAVFGGILVGSVFLLEVMVADTVDYGAIQSGKADYGSYFGIWKLGSKFSRAVAIGLSGLLLEAIGFEAHAEPQESTLKAIAWLFGPGVGLFFIGGAVLVLFYPLHAQRVAQIQRILRKRRPFASAS
jgi:Na+/melibiose symporter-like transporter